MYYLEDILIWWRFFRFGGVCVIFGGGCLIFGGYFLRWGQILQHIWEGLFNIWGICFRMLWRGDVVEFHMAFLVMMEEYQVWRGSLVNIWGGCFRFGGGCLRFGEVV